MTETTPFDSAVGEAGEVGSAGARTRAGVIGETGVGAEESGSTNVGTASAQHYGGSSER